MSNDLREKKHHKINNWELEINKRRDFNWIKIIPTPLYSNSKLFLKLQFKKRVITELYSRGNCSR